MTQAVSFCDCMELSAEMPALPDHTAWIYCGSYFCDRYFLETPERCWEGAAALAERHQAAMVLVIPIAGQLLLERLKRRVTELLACYPVAEIVVNDYGMCAWLREMRLAQPIWFGRLLAKDIRDPRYALAPAQLKLHERAAQGEAFGFRPYGVEADLTEAVDDIGDLQRCALALHVPLTYLTTGRICELASVGMELSRKFRPGMPCGRQCVSHWLTYTRRGLTYYKFGRAVYTRAPELPEAWRALPIRLIHNLMSRRIDHEGSDADS